MRGVSTKDVAKIRIDRLVTNSGKTKGPSRIHQILGIKNWENWKRNSLVI